jgi:hypothetical protein
LGSLVLDHNLVLQLWDDPLFWETVLWAENLRESAEEAVAQAQLVQSSLILKNSSVYNLWLEQLTALWQENPSSLKSLIDYIRQKRQRTDESILVPRCGAKPITIAGRE